MEEIMDNISGLSLLEIAVKVIEERKEPININELNELSIIIVKIVGIP